MIDGNMTTRSEPICFWNYNAGREARQRNAKPWIEPILQVGTTPLVKMMDGRYTRNFHNLHHPKISDQDFAGSRAILGNRYKFVVDGQSGGEIVKELFDVRDAPAEAHNVIEEKPEIASSMEQRLRDWQQSVLTSLTGADYRKR